MTQKINVKLMKPIVYKTLQANAGETLKSIKDNPDNSNWLKKQFPNGIYEDLDITIDDFTLFYDDDYMKYAVENGKRLYETLNDLPARVLYSPYFWAWITFEKAYRQAQQTVRLNKTSTLEYSWFPRPENRKASVRGAVSREFVKVKMSIDEKSDNPYELTDCLFNNRTLYHNLSERNLCDNDDFSHAVLRVTKKIYDRSGHILTRDECNDLLKIGYNIGSVMLIDSLTPNEIETILENKFKQKYPELF